MTPRILASPQRQIVLSFSIAVFVYFFSAWTVAVYLPIYLDKVVGLSRTAIGSLISMYTVTLILLVAPFGHLSDRVSPKRLTQTGMLLFAVHCVILAHARALTPLLFGQLIGGIGNSMVIIALPSLYYKHINTSRKGKKVGVYMFSTFFGFAIGPLVGGFLLRDCGVSYRGVFLAVAGLVLALFLFSNLLKDTAPFKIKLLEYKEDLFRKEVFLLICMLVAMGIHYGNERTSLPLYMTNVIGVDEFGVGSLFAVIGLWIAILAMLTGMLWDRNKKVLLFTCLGLVISGLSHMATSFTNTYASVLLVRMLHTTGDALIMFSMQAIIASIFPTHRMGGNVGFTAFFRMFGAFLGAAMSGYLDGHASYRASFIVAGSSTVIVGILLAASWRTMLSLSRQLSK